MLHLVRQITDNIIAFSYFAFILANLCDRADRPQATQYIASYYNQEEIKQLLECLNNEPMRIAVILTAYYGLRRSEVLGIKWSAIDWTENKITIRHKVIENKLEGGRIEGHDVMKTKSSYRSLPLIPQVKEILLEEKAKQESMRKLLRGAYNKKYLDYVCVDAIGDILTPKYILKSSPLTTSVAFCISANERRLGCSQMAISGAKITKRKLGSIPSTLRIYLHT